MGALSANNPLIYSNARSRFVYTIAGEMHSPAFISQWVIYARTIFYLCHVATRASHCHGIEGFRSITRDAYRALVRLRSCRSLYRKKSCFVETRLVRPASRGSSRDVEASRGATSCSKGVIDPGDDLCRSLGFLLIERLS